jgi:signal transduction histidine kinase
MHALALIPFAAVLIAAAFGGISLAWNSDRRDTRAMTLIFGCAGIWAFSDLCVQLQSAREEAIFWLRVSHVPPLFLGPLALMLLEGVLPQCAPGLRSWRRWGLAWAVLLGVGCAFMPEVVVAATRTSWGDWMPHFGIIGVLLFPLGAILPIVAARRALRVGSRSNERADLARAQAMVGAVCFAVGVALLTELLLPLLEIPAPRLGALAVVVGTGMMWLGVLHQTDTLALTPHGIARAVLAELHDGVALVGLDGTILSVNGRLAELTHRSDAELIGLPLDSIVNVSFDDLRGGCEDRESILAREGADSLPVALSSCRAHDLRGHPIGVVVIFRDLRDVDILRRQLLASGRLAAIGELAAGIAHEVNNPVAFIRADLNFLSSRLDELREMLAKEIGFGEDLPIFATGPERVERALEGIERIAEVVGDVRSFAHMGGIGQGGGDPVALVEGALRLAKLERRDEVEIRVRSGGVTGRIAAGQEMKQALLAMLRLLVTRSARGGCVEVEVEPRAGQLRIALRADRLVEPAAALITRFERALAEGGRSSRADLGVAIAAELVAQMGGSLRAAQEGEGRVRIEMGLPFEEEAAS